MIRGGAVKVFVGRLLYTDTADSYPATKTLFTIPKGHVVIDAFVQVVTPFDGSTAATVDIGDSADPDGIIPSSNIDTTTAGFQALQEDQKGAYLWSASGVKKDWAIESDTDIIATYTLSGDETQGELRVYVVTIDLNPYA